MDKVSSYLVWNCSSSQGLNIINFLASYMGFADEDLVIFCKDYANGLGVEYAEARYHAVRGEGVLLRNRELEPGVIYDSSGIGIRVIHKGSLVFASTNILTRESVKEVLEGAIKQAKSASSLVKEGVRLSEERSVKATWGVEEKERIEDVDQQSMIKYLLEVEDVLKDGALGVPFSNRFLILSKGAEEKVFANTEGTVIRSRVPRVSYYGYIAASYGGRMYTFTIPPGHTQIAGSGGWEILKSLAIIDTIKEDAIKLARVVKEAKEPPKGVMDLVLGPQITGLACHESSGHPQEADRILGREAAQAGESYLKAKDLGYKIGSKEAHVIDDPTIKMSNSFYLYDDEGVPAEKRTLIEEGIIKEFLHNRSTATAFGIRSNGSSRASAYDREPIVRMSNTYLEPGDYTLEELVSGVKEGVYMASFQEWNIDDIRLNQRYVGMEAYRIENGELKEPVLQPVLELTTPKFWSSIDARGKALSYSSATCGKGDPMQGIPVWTGGPHARLRGVRIWSRN